MDLCKGEEGKEGCHFIWIFFGSPLALSLAGYPAPPAGYPAPPAGYPAPPAGEQETIRVGRNYCLYLCFSGTQITPLPPHLHSAGYPAPPAGYPAPPAGYPGGYPAHAPGYPAGEGREEEEERDGVGCLCSYHLNSLVLPQQILQGMLRQATVVRSEGRVMRCAVYSSCETPLPHPFLSSLPFHCLLLQPPCPWPTPQAMQHPWDTPWVPPWQCP